MELNSLQVHQKTASNPQLFSLENKKSKIKGKHTKRR